MSTNIRDLQKFFIKKEYPSMIIFDVTNTCNLRCIHCPQPLLQKEPDFFSINLKIDHVVKVLDEIKDGKEQILLRFAGDGEPTVNKDLYKMIEKSKQLKNTIVNLTTNGILMDEEKIINLLNSKIDLIDISIDALTKETYRKVRVGGNFDKLMNNINFLLNKVKLNKLSTKVMVSFVEQHENKNEVEGFKNFWKSKVDYVMVRSLHSAVESLSEQKNLESKLNNQSLKIERYPCPHLWKRLTIDFLGNIKFCAHEWNNNNDVILGNLKNTSIKSAWTGKIMQEARKSHIENNFKEGHICQKCTDWASSKWDYGYERLVDRVVNKKPTLYPN